MAGVAHMSPAAAGRVPAPPRARGGAGGCALRVGAAPRHVVSVHVLTTKNVKKSLTRMGAVVTTRRRRRAANVVVRASSFSSSSAAAPLYASPSAGRGDGPAFAEACDLDDAVNAAERELKQNVKPYLDAHPCLVVSRVIRIAASTAYVALAWMSKNPRRGVILRDAVAELGPVFVKLGEGGNDGGGGGGQGTSTAYSSLTQTRCFAIVILF